MEAMDKHQRLVDELKVELQQDPNNIALLATGSFARGEITPQSDLDLILIAKQKGEFVEKTIEGVLVEIKSNTIKGYEENMSEKPMAVYQWLEGKVVFDKDDIIPKLVKKAQSIYDNYKTPINEIKGIKKWLDSVKIKIIAAETKRDEMSIGFNTANVLWIIIQGFYLINNKPVPPSTTAFRKIKELKILPINFQKLWEKLLTGDLEERKDATLKLIEFITK